MSTDKIIDRVKKLLSLSKSTNEHEAAAAAAQAADLMLKHEIKEAALCDAENEPEDPTQETLDSAGRRVSWKSSLAHGITLSAGCQSYSDHRGGGCKTQIVGPPSKLATIRYMYQYLTGEIDRLANTAYGAEHKECSDSGVPAPSARSWKNAFRLGASATIRKRLLAQRKETHKAAAAAGQSQALVVVKTAEEAVAIYIKQTVGPLRSSSRAQHSSRSGYGAGADAGRGVSLGGGRGLGAGAKRLGSGS
jgi:hypothetical protein